jgi:universal stress protein A
MIHNVKRMLSPIDFSEFSFEAMRGAWELAKDVGAELHLLHVVVPHTIFVPLLLTQDAEGAREMAREAGMMQQADEELARIRKDQLENSPKVVTSSVVGPPVPKIIDYAEREAINLIVLSSHGRTGFNRMLIGSVAEKLVRGAPCSVLVLRAHA